jgi:prepilin-type N-terminal cleavage/methylation domain-containing protein
VPCLSRSRRSAGFTLIETLVALTIAAAAAAVILSYVRTLMLRAEREQAHQLAAMRLLNDGMRLVYGGAQDTGEPRLERDRLVFLPRDTAPGAMPPVEVRNFSPLGETLPAVGLAYTPFQLYGVEREGYRLHRIGPGLAPPPGAAPLSAGAVTPDMLQSPPPQNPAAAAAKAAAAPKAK